MPGKHVRFASTNLMYSPLSPSPTNDSSSLPGSPFDHTTQPLKHVDTPYNNSPLLLEDSESIPALGPSIHINYLLGFSTIPPIIYDISRQPAFITTPHNQALDVGALAESATLPPSLSITLVSDLLPWSIVITPSSPKQDPHISVSDVITTLHRALRLAVHPDEFNALPSHDAKYKVNVAYESRYKRLEGVDPRACEEEKKKGVKRIDFLMGRTMFMGLSPCPQMGSNIWVINVS